MPFVNMKKASSQSGSSKSFSVKVTTMDAELEFRIEVNNCVFCDLDRKRL